MSNKTIGKVFEASGRASRLIILYPLSLYNDFEKILYKGDLYQTTTIDGPSAAEDFPIERGLKIFSKDIGNLAQTCKVYCKTIKISYSTLLTKHIARWYK